MTDPSRINSPLIINRRLHFAPPSLIIPPRRKFRFAAGLSFLSAYVILTNPPRMKIFFRLRFSFLTETQSFIIFTPTKITIHPLIMQQIAESHPINFPLNKTSFHQQIPLPIDLQSPKNPAPDNFPASPNPAPRSTCGFSSRSAHTSPTFSHRRKSQFTRES